MIMLVMNMSQLKLKSMVGWTHCKKFKYFVSETHIRRIFSFHGQLFNFSYCNFLT